VELPPCVIPHFLHQALISRAQLSDLPIHHLVQEVTNLVGTSPPQSARSHPTFWTLHQNPYLPHHIQSPLTRTHHPDPPLIHWKAPTSTSALPWHLCSYPQNTHARYTMVSLGQQILVPSMAVAKICNQYMGRGWKDGTHDNNSWWHVPPRVLDNHLKTVVWCAHLRNQMLLCYLISFGQWCYKHEGYVFFIISTELPPPNSTWKAITWSKTWIVSRPRWQNEDLAQVCR